MTKGAESAGSVERQDTDVLDLVASWVESDPESETNGQSEILNDPWHTAIHEAGHAVVGRALGLDMGWSTVNRDGNSAGHCLVGDPYANLDRWWREGHPTRQLWDVACARVIMLMAGPEAELAILGRLQDADGEHGDESDRREIARLMEYHPRDEDGAEIRLASLRRSARRLVLRHRAEVEHVASELRDHGTVPGFDLDAMAPRPAPRDSDSEWLALLTAEPEGEPANLVLSV